MFRQEFCHISPCCLVMLRYGNTQPLFIENLNLSTYLNNFELRLHFYSFETSSKIAVKDLKSIFSLVSQSHSFRSFINLHNAITDGRSMISDPKSLKTYPSQHQSGFFANSMIGKSFLDELIQFAKVQFQKTFQFSTIILLSLVMPFNLTFSYKSRM